MIIDKSSRTVAMILSASPFRGQAVLEIGCGDGRVSKELFHLATEYIAIDPNSEAVAKAASNRTVTIMKIAGLDLMRPVAENSHGFTYFLVGASRRGFVAWIPISQ